MPPTQFLCGRFSGVDQILTTLLHSSHFGHDKSLEIKPYAALPDGERPILLYAGDGVSDLSAAAETNLLFAKEGKGNYRIAGSARAISGPRAIGD